MARARTRTRTASGTGAGTTARRAPVRRPTRRQARQKVELTNIETKLAEVIGLAMAAQGAGERVEKLTKDRELSRTLKQMRQEAAQTEKDSTTVAGGIRGKKGAIMQEARSVKKKADSMMRDYLGRSPEALDGFEFLTMAEAGEVGHWSVLGELNKSAKDPAIGRLVRTYLPIQKRHLKNAQDGSLRLASKEDPNAAA
jgi:hypothetical protein